MSTWRGQASCCRSFGVLTSTGRLLTTYDLTIAPTTIARDFPDDDAAYGMRTTFSRGLLAKLRPPGSVYACTRTSGAFLT
jgi:hypothetical protein